MSIAESAAATMPVREDSSVGRKARCQTRSTKNGSSPITSGARSSSMVATRACGDAAVFQASPTPRWPVSVSRKTSTMTFSCQRVRGFQTRPSMSRRTMRGMTFVTLHDRQGRPAARRRDNPRFAGRAATQISTSAAVKGSDHSRPGLE